MSDNDINEIGGYDNDFDPEVDRKYKCPVCLAVLRDPVQTMCGHRFCKRCLTGVARNQVQTFARCPVDNTWLKLPEEVFTDNATRREVLSLTVKCEQTTGDERCDWKGELREIEEHLNTCSKVRIPCNYDCGAAVSRGELTAHKSTCKRRPVQCCHCEQKLPSSDIPKHQLLDCEKFPVTCTICGDVGIIRQNISDHWNTFCPLVEVQCTYSELGCQAEEKRQNLEKHLKENVVQHSSLMLKRMHKLETKVDSALEKLEGVQNAVASFHR